MQPSRRNLEEPLFLLWLDKEALGQNCIVMDWGLAQALVRGIWCEIICYFRSWGSCNILVTVTQLLSFVLYQQRSSAVILFCFWLTLSRDGDVCFFFFFL